jgi:hypothetical protein
MGRNFFHWIVSGLNEIINYDQDVTCCKQKNPTQIKSTCIVSLISGISNDVKTLSVLLITILLFVDANSKTGTTGLGTYERISYFKGGWEEKKGRKK